MVTDNLTTKIFDAVIRPEHTVFVPLNNLDEIAKLKSDLIAEDAKLKSDLIAEDAKLKSDLIAELEKYNIENGLAKQSLQTKDTTNINKGRASTLLGRYLKNNGAGYSILAGYQAFVDGLDDPENNTYSTGGQRLFLFGENIISKAKNNKLILALFDNSILEGEFNFIANKGNIKGITLNDDGTIKANGPLNDNGTLKDFQTLLALFNQGYGGISKGNFNLGNTIMSLLLGNHCVNVGDYIVNNGNYNINIGSHLISLKDYLANFGKYNEVNPNALLSVGNGTSDTDRHNAFEVLKDNRAKVKGAPIEDDDVVRKVDLNNLNTGRKLYRHNITIQKQSSDGSWYDALFSFVFLSNDSRSLQDLFETHISANISEALSILNNSIRMQAKGYVRDSKDVELQYIEDIVMQWNETVGLRVLAVHWLTNDQFTRRVSTIQFYYPPPPYVEATWLARIKDTVTEY